MAQQSEPVYVIQRRRTRYNKVILTKPTPWENVRVADDRVDARLYRDRQNAKAKKFEFRVDPKRITKL